MNNDIMEKIKQINLGIIPSGYKNTEIGISPFDWKKYKLGDLLSFKNGINTDKEKFGTGIKLISVNDILAEKPIMYDDIAGSVDVDDKTLANYSVTYGDILFQRSSENFEDAGKSNVYLDVNNTATYSGFVIRGKKIGKYNPYCLNELLKTDRIRKQIIRYAAGSQHINVGQDSLSKVMLYIASDKEQNQIVEVLSSWNEVIILQKKLLEKLELQRKAIIQKTLKPGNEWEKIKLGDFTKEISIRNKENDCKNIKSVSNKFGFINQDEQFSKQVASQDTTNYKKVSYGNVVYNPSRINVGSIAIYKQKETGIVSPMYVVFECKEIDPELLVLLLSTDRGQYDIKAYLTGSVRDTLSYSDLAKIELFIPNTFMQKKIINLFSEVDNIIELQKKKLEKLKLQQMSMQQLLLTGIVRV
jgi:type I restriction enzyme S subunit